MKFVCHVLDTVCNEYNNVEAVELWLFAAIIRKLRLGIKENIVNGF